MLNAATDTTSTARPAPPSPVRDRQPANSGFSSLVDDNAAATTEAAPRPSRNDDSAPRASDTPRGRDSQTQDDPGSPDTDRVSASADDASSPPPVVIGKSSAPVKKNGKAAADGSEPAKTGDAVPGAAAPDAAVAVPDAAATAAPPPVVADPVAVAVPVVTAALTAPAPAAPPPLAIAAAGLAAAKAVTTKTPGAPPETDRTGDQPAIDAMQSGDPTAAPSAAGKPTKAGARPAAAPPDLTTDTGFAKVGVAKADGKPATDAAAPVTAKTAPKTDTAAPDSKPKDTTATGDAPAAADAKPQARDHRVAGPAAPAAPDAVPTGPAAAAPPSPVQAADVSPTAPLTATVATAQPVPLNGLAVELAARATGGASRFEIRLDPAELGRIDVRIDVDKQGNVTSHLTVEKPETLAMLRQDAPQLQRALSDAGFKTSDSGLQFSLGDQSQSQARQNYDGDRQASQHFIIRDDDTAASAAPVRSYGRMVAARSGVDISV